MFIANAIRTNLKENFRALTLCGQVHAADPSSLDKARIYLEKALALKPNHTETIICLVEVCAQLKQQNRSIALYVQYL